MINVCPETDCYILSLKVLLTRVKYIKHFILCKDMQKSYLPADEEFDNCSKEHKIWDLCISHQRNSIRSIFLY